MRNGIAILTLLVVLFATNPAEAQFRADGSNSGQVQLYSDTDVGSVLNSLFSSEHFRMGHSYQMSHTSMGGQSLTSGMYTNTMMWQFNDQLAARVDVSLLQPMGGSLLQDNQQPQVFLRNAELAYRPSENTTIHFSIQQSPRGSFMSPYGYGYSPYGGAGSFNMEVGNQPRSLFWRDGQMN